MVSVVLRRVGVVLVALVLVGCLGFTRVTVNVDVPLDVVAGWDETVAGMISQISESEIYDTAYDLQNFLTRRRGTSGNVAAAAYLYERLADISGLSVEYFGFYNSVIATLNGADPLSDVVFMVGAHYDSRSSDPDYAPGATDNGGGVGIVLEFARIMSQYRFDHTLKFAFWNAEEEFVCFGSDEYAAYAHDNNVNIALYVNYDSACYDPDSRLLLDIMYNGASEWVSVLMTQLNSVYDINFTLRYNGHSCRSDHTSFWQRGFTAVTTHAESHGPAGTPDDTVDKVSTRYAKKNGQLGMALLAELAGVESAHAHLNVRGMDNRVYHRLYNSSSSEWENWSAVTSGATRSSPAAAKQGGRLYIAVRGMDGYSLWFSWVNLSDDSFSGWEWLSGATSSAPTLVCHRSELILVVRGLDNRVYYRFYDCTSGDWGSWASFPSGATCDSPAAAVLDGSLHMVVRGFSRTNADANNSLWHATLNLTTETFSGWSWLPGSTPSAPATSGSQPLQKLYLTVRGMDNRIYYNVWSDGRWEGWSSLPSGVTSDSPTGVVIGEALHIVVRGFTGTSLWHYSINLSTNDHSGWEYMSGAALSAPALAN